MPRKQQNPKATAKSPNGDRVADSNDFGDRLLSASGDMALLFIRDRLAEGAEIQIATSDGRSAPSKKP